MAPKSRVAKAETQLATAEAEFRAMVLHLMPSGLSRGVDYFTNSEFNQHPQGPAPRNTAADALLAAARRCLALRRSLSLSPRVRYRKRTWRHAASWPPPIRIAAAHVVWPRLFLRWPSTMASNPSLTPEAP